jgi:hypothetical protein
VNLVNWASPRTTPAAKTAPLERRPGLSVSPQAFGDLGGAFIINPAANKADREYVEAVNKRWTGIKEPHFRRCALRARENNLPGVTVLAVGAVRAQIVLQCLKLGLINHLILDTDCADELQGLAR